MRRMRGKATDREPLYGEQDVERTIARFSTLDYGELKTITDGINVKYVDAGHILGAASVQMTIEDAGRTVTIVFSGDIGQVGAPIVRDPITPTPADAVLIESTYGDRDHRSLAETCDEFLAILKQAQARGSKVIIPAFALGRAQDLIFHIGEFLRTGRLKSVNVYVDSPMAAAISAHYARHTEFHDERASELARENMRPLQFPGLKHTQSVEESKRLNDATGSLVIIAANGMCTGGRVVHHLRHSLSNPNTHIVIVGYQGHGTLGRRLVDGAKFVSIFGDEMPVRAQVHTLGGFSAHAGQSGLLNWIAPFQELKPRVFLTHGEDGPRGVLRDQLQARFQLASTLPYYGDEVEI
jgi:metallo-beta-lactamase family protein